MRPRREPKTIVKTCIHCNGEFDVFLYQKDERKFCSKLCYDKHRSASKIKIVKVCEWCEKEFYPRDDDRINITEAKSRRFCTRSCATKFQNEKESKILYADVVGRVFDN